MPALRRRHVTLRTALWLLVMQLLVGLVAVAAEYLRLSSLSLLYVLAGVQLLGVLTLVVVRLRNLRKTAPPNDLRAFATADLPTLTVALPARNETDSLQACLQSLLASDYPKLEILVLDDCSQTKRTPEIIKAFAQSGVRFIAGKEPPPNWLAKNYAYQQLAEQANGELLLFCGVDCRFAPDSLSRLVTILLRVHQDMLSVMPANQPKARLRLTQLLLQPNRYAWEIGLPRLFAKRPPVLSSCWLIRRAALKKAGGFEAVRRSIVPEAYLARYCAASGGKYRFIRSEAGLEITSLKTAEEQKETSVRMRYPQLHRRPEMVALISLLELGLFVWPPLMLVIAGVYGFGTLAWLAGASFVIGSLNHGEIINLTYRRFVLRGLVLLPLAALYDIWLLNYSMWRYESGEVLWKGRNICLPAIRPIPPMPSQGSAQTP